MKISVLMAVYNTKEEYLRDAIESILNQTYTDYEFLILNDGSTDTNVEKIILSYNDKRIKYFYQDNQGIAKSRNKLMSLAQGEYLAICDHDDISDATRFAKQVKILDENPNIGVVSSNIEYFPNNKHIHINPQYPKLMDFLRFCALAHPCAMLKKSYFEKFNLSYKTNYPSAEDYELWTRAVRYFDLYNIPEVLLQYRWHKTNVSVTQLKMQQKYDYMIKENILNFLESDETKKEKLRNFIFLKKPFKWYHHIFSMRTSYDKERTKTKTVYILGFKFTFTDNEKL